MQCGSEERALKLRAYTFLCVPPLFSAFELRLRFEDENVADIAADTGTGGTAVVASKASAGGVLSADRKTRRVARIEYEPVVLDADLRTRDGLLDARKFVVGAAHETVFIREDLWPNGSYVSASSDDDVIAGPRGGVHKVRFSCVIGNKLLFVAPCVLRCVRISPQWFASCCVL